MAFSGVDKALLQRAARILEEGAADLEKSETVEGGWGKARAAKREFDALLRDARDLRSLAKRLGLAPARRVRKAPVDLAGADAKRMEDGFGAALNLTRAAVNG